MRNCLALMGWFIAALALAMAVAAVYAALAGEPTGGLVVALAVTGFIAVTFVIAFNADRITLTTAQALALAVALWFVLAAFGALPLALSREGSTLAAYADALSALTVSGAVFGSPVHTLPSSLALWLFLMQWIGGGATILIVVLILGPRALGGLPSNDLRAVEHGGGCDKLSLKQTFEEIAPLYLATTSLVWIALQLAGLSPFDAFCLATSALSTGGLTPKAGGVADYANPAAEMILTVAMLIGATSIVWLRLVVVGRWRSAATRREVWASVAATAALAGLFTSAILGRLPDWDGGDLATALRQGLFLAASLISTTGMPLFDNAFSLLPLSATTIAAFIGGATYSAAGGLKIKRAETLLLLAARELSRALYPNRVERSRLAGAALPMGVAMSTWTAFLVLGVGFAATFAALAPAIGDFTGAYAAAVGAVANVMPLYAELRTGDWPALSTLPDSSVFILIVAMVFGRIEALAVVAVVTLAFWRR